MAEDITKPDSEVPTESAVDSEQVSADSQDADTQATSEEKTNASKPRIKRRAGPWVFLLVIFVGLPAAWVFSPPELRQQAMDLFNAGKTRLQTKQSTPPISPSIIDKQSQMEEADPVQASTAISIAKDSSADATENPSGAEPEAPVDIATPLESTPQTRDNSASLQEEINRLQSELHDMQAEREQLLQQLKSGKTDEFRVWLSLLASPETRLSQQADMWGYLASSPSLNTSQQAKAKEMGMLLDSARTRLATVGKALRHLADGIPEAQQTDIIPKPQNQYLAWLLSAFHLRPAPGGKAQQGDALRRQLLDMEHALNLNDWPEPHKWRQLLSALSKQFGDDAELGLPDSLSDITGDIDDSRAAAAAWMETL